HAGQLPALVLEKRLAALHRQPVDDVAEKAEQPHLGQRDAGRHQRRDDDDRPRTLRVVQTERNERAWRFNRFFRRKGIQEIFEPAIHEKVFSFYLCPLRGPTRALRAPPLKPAPGFSAFARFAISCPDVNVVPGTWLGWVARPRTLRNADDRAVSGASF